MSNPLANPLVRIMIGAGVSTVLTPRILVKIAPQLGGVVNPASGRFALTSDATPEQIKVATQSVIGLSAVITTLVFVGIGMAFGESAAAAVAAAGKPAGVG